MLALVGEAFGLHESLLSLPFVGPAGQELNSQLIVAELLPPRLDSSDWPTGTRLAGERDAASLLTLNVFDSRPPDNLLSEYGCSKRDALLLYPQELPRLRAAYPDFEWPAKYVWPALTQGPTTFLHPSRLGVLPELRAKLQGVSVAVALGSTALWALCGGGMISKLRGFARPSTLVPGLTVLPTWHPAAVLRQFSLRPTAIADLKKADQLHRNPPSYETRFLTISPTLQEVAEWIATHITPQPHEPVSVDIETASPKPDAEHPHGFILCVGFGVGCYALCIPFRHAIDRRGSYANFWATQDEEEAAWALVQAALSSANPKVFHNLLFDLHWLFRKHGLHVSGPIHDSMILHHALQPESPKALDYLVSLYMHWPSWKSMRREAGIRATDSKDTGEG